MTAGTTPARTPAQEQADRILGAALDEVAEAYGRQVATFEEWCIAWGGEDANDCAGRLEYDDEAEADEMRQWIDGGIVARQTVIRLPWQTVPAEGESEPASVAEPAATQAPEAARDTFQMQACRYFRAAYGPDYLYQPPESFGLLERWIWAVGAAEEKFAEQTMAELERAIAEHRNRSEEGS